MNSLTTLLDVALGRRGRSSRFTAGWDPGLFEHRERARFDAEDPQDLVDLAFGCPFCGGQAGVPILRSKPWEWHAEARCRCTTCEQSWVLDLDLAQIRRLSLT
jgi:hypothetical protein